MTISPANAVANPPEIWEIEDPIPIKAPLSVAVGILENKVDEEIIRAVIPTKRTALSAITAHNGVASKWQ